MSIKILKALALTAIVLVLPILPALLFLEYVLTRMFNWPSILANRVLKLFITI